MKRLEAAGARVLPWVPLLTAIVIILRIQPYFGNMDDSRFIDGAGATNPLSYAIAFFSPELGFVRSASLAIVWPAAWLGYHLGASAYFLVNAVVATACLAAFAWTYGKVANWHGRWLFPAFMGIAFLWPFTADLIFFPSLSEKGIILGGAALLLWVKAWSTTRLPWLQLGALVPLTAFAFATKTQVLLFVPGVMAALWICPKPSGDRFILINRWVATALWMSSSLVLLLLARTGSYTSSTQGNLDSQFLFDRRFQLLFGLLGLYVFALIWRLARGDFKNSDIIPAVFLATVCMAFPIWEIRNYYLAVASVGTAAAIVTVLSWFGSQRLIVMGAITSILLSSLWLAYRLPQVLASLASVRLFLESDTAQQLSIDEATILVSCSEAPIHYNSYAERFNVSGADFRFTDEGAGIAQDEATYIFADSRLCPWPASIPRDGWQPVWTSPSGSEAYILFHFRLGQQ